MCEKKLDGQDVAQKTIHEVEKASDDAKPVGLCENYDFSIGWSHTTTKNVK